MLWRALIAAALATAAAGPPDSRLLDRTHDELLRRAFIPSARNVHGEFRLLRRGDATCAETLLYTPMLRRALQRIRKKEQRAWPAGEAGYEDSQTYLAALEEAKSRILAAAPEGKLQTMAIEFVVAPHAALFALSELEIERVAGEVTIRKLRPIVVREVSPDYARRAIEEQKAAAFDESEEAAP